MLIALFPVLVLILGLLLWAMATNPKAQEAGRLAYFSGLLVVCFVAAKYTLHLPQRP